MCMKNDKKNDISKYNLKPTTYQHFISQDSPNDRPRPPKSPRGPLRTLPGHSQGPQGCPRTSQETPKGPQGSSKDLQRTPKDPQGSQKHAHSTSLIPQIYAKHPKSTPPASPKSLQRSLCVSKTFTASQHL